MEQKRFTISVFSENHIGLLNRIAIVLTKRKINIESLTTSESETKGIHRFTIVIYSTEDQTGKVTKQIEKLIDVLMASYYTDDEVVHQEIALYKVPLAALANSDEVEKIIRRNNARILTIENEYIVIEKTGYKQETQELFDKLKPYGIYQFVRSGRIAVSKERIELADFLKKHS